MAKVANPQGKGEHLLSTLWFSVVILQDKSDPQIINDYVLAMLVLSAKFSFKPVTGSKYFLYLWKGQLRLSLIPEDKCQIEDVECIAFCELRADLTWQVELKKTEKLSLCAQESLQEFVNALQSRVDKASSFAELLPYYEETLPFYRRLYAAGLAKSLSLSASKSGLLNGKPKLQQQIRQLTSGK